MLVCHCKRVNDTKIRQLVEAGARTVGQIATACGAGTSCGSCVKTIAEVLAASRPLPITTFNTQISGATLPDGGAAHPNASLAGTRSTSAASPADFLAAE